MNKKCPPKPVLPEYSEETLDSVAQRIINAGVVLSETENVDLGTIGAIMFASALLFIKKSDPTYFSNLNLFKEHILEILEETMEGPKEQEEEFMLSQGPVVTSKRKIHEGTC